MKRRIWTALASGIICSGMVAATESFPETSESRPQYSGQDLLLLKDGSLLQGRVAELPQLGYGFGKYPLKCGELVSLVRDPSGRWVALTNQGWRFSGSFAGSRLRFRQGQEEHDVPLEEVESLFFSPSKPQPLKKGYQLTFANGDQLPVNLAETTLFVTDGKNKKAILAEEIDEVSFNGALRGSLRDSSGKISSLSLCFVCQQHLAVKLPNQGETVRLPWSSIERIEKESEQERVRLMAQSIQKRAELLRPKPILSLLKNEVDSDEIAFEEDKPVAEPEIPQKAHEPLNINMVALLEELDVYPEEAAGGKLFAPLEEPPTVIQEEKAVETPQEIVYEKNCYVEDPSGCGFYIDRKKVSNREYQAFVRSVGYKTPIHWKGGEIPAGDEEKPVVNVTYRDVLLYAIWSGKKLPSWPQLKAASGASGTLIDSDDGLNEWTCSMESSENGTAFKTFGKEKQELIVNGERNMHTGFRLVTE